MKKSILGSKFPLLAIIALFILGGCGYKPSAHYIQNVFDGSVYVDVIVSPSEPENAVYVNDALRRMVIARFGGRLAPRAQAENVIIASYNGTIFTPISYDVNGYITRYRADVQMVFSAKTKKGKFDHVITTFVEADISASSSLSSGLRIQAIRTGMEKALDQFLAYVAARGALDEESAAK